MTHTLRMLGLGSMRIIEYRIARRAVLTEQNVYSAVPHPDLAHSPDYSIEDDRHDIVRRNAGHTRQFI